jgi:hypothetical protein
MIDDTFIADKMNSCNCYFEIDEVVQRRACLSHWRINIDITKEIKTYYRVKSVPLEKATAYLEWFNENVYPIKFDDKIITYKVLSVDGKFVYKNNLVIYSILRQLWEGKGKEEKFNMPLIDYIIEGEKTLEDFLTKYEDLINNSGIFPHAGHALLNRNYYTLKEPTRFTRKNITKKDLVTNVFQSAEDFTKYIK